MEPVVDLLKDTLRLCFIVLFIAVALPALLLWIGQDALNKCEEES